MVVHDDPDSGTKPGSTGTNCFSILDNFDNRDKSWTCEGVTDILDQRFLPPRLLLLFASRIRLDCLFR